MQKDVTMAGTTPSYPGSHASDERRSGIAFTGILLLVLLAVAFPEMAPQGLSGILWTGAGLLMILLPPEVRLPRLWVLLAAGFVLFSLVGFLPREWFHVSPWRGDLEKLGLDTGSRAFVQPWLAVEVMAGFAATTLVVLYMLGHRIDSRCQHRLALGFALGVGAVTTAALVIHKPGELFGFFPNRNHTATLLVMGTFAGLGSLAHAIRRKNFWKIVLSIIPVGVCLYALHAVSESRAGVVLVFAGFVLWICLIGFSHLRGNAGKALSLILIAAVGIFFIVDSTSKKRLTATVEQMAPPEPVSKDTPENPFTEDSIVRLDPSTDGRVAIFQDTLEMIRHESWPGVGPGQFSFVFPQYRIKTNASNDARCLHPESDWLLMLSETGWPATLFLTAGVSAVFFTAVRQARRDRARFLRMGCIVAALLLCLHGIFDVPGHRVGLAWAAALLLAGSLRIPAETGQDPIPEPSRLTSHCWRGLGAILTLAGIFLLYVQWTQLGVLPSVQVGHRMREAKSLYDRDQAAYDRAKAGGGDYQPIPSEDPIETALLLLKQVIEITPLEPHPHYIQGVLALHYDDKHAIANRAFAIQRRLVPTRVALSMEQSQAWLLQDPRQVLVLWKDAMRRAAAEEARSPDSPFGTEHTYGKILQMAGKEDALVKAALELADGNPRLLLLWARFAPADSLDQEMPILLPASAQADERKMLFQIWEKRGSKDRAATFSRNHTELGLTPQ